MIILLLSQLCSTLSFCQNSYVMKSIALPFQIFHERQESSFHIKSREDQLLPSRRSVCHILLQLWYSVIFESVASSCVDYSPFMRWWHSHRSLVHTDLDFIAGVCQMSVLLVACWMANSGHSFWKLNNTKYDLLKNLSLIYVAGGFIRQKKKVGCPMVWL